MNVHGTCDPRFGEVREEFERNLAERGEADASVCVTLNGETVVDLWGGGSWAEDSLVQVWSCTKGATALCAHILASRGELDFDAPVAEYWPEFAAARKEGVLVRHLLSHQAGLPAVRAPLPAGAFYDWKLMVDALAAEEPFWEPGTRNGYHALTFGFLVGEVVRRVSGRSLGTFFREEVAEPLGIEFWIGLPEELEQRVLPTVPPALAPPFASFYGLAFADPASISALVIGNNGGYMNPGESDSRAAHAAEMGAIGGITNARGLAALYLGLPGLVSPEQVVLMGATISATSVDATLLVPTRFTLGYGKSMDNRHLPPGDSEGILLSEDAFGHSGMGGSIGFLDQRAGISFGYAMTRQGSGLGINERGQSLVDAVYRALGYRQVKGGSWYA
ncbi:beta-lactamase family protein [Streptosporangiaceae bacterium NEAU-GS5]|nr:beta-lactamase family protein [Streptosporangiaceae bacterium NEAU-GS5]